jgi:hypothetical protein
MTPARASIRFLVTAPGVPGGLVVVGQYAPDGCDGWLIGVAPHDPKHEDVPIPPWPMVLRPCAGTPYSPELLVEVPDNFDLRCLEREDEEDEEL